MKCVYCAEKAGFLKTTCRDCIRLVDTFNRLKGSFGFRELLDQLLATGISPKKIELFLERDVDGTGSLRDYLTARMTNEVMAGLGQPSHMTARDVQKVRGEIKEGKPPSTTDAEVVDYSQLKNKS